MPSLAPLSPPLLTSLYFSDWMLGPFGIVALVYTTLHHIVWPLFQPKQQQQLPTMPHHHHHHRHHLQGKYAIVTGSNTGIGYETAKSLVLNYNMQVILACRSRDKGERAAEQINKEKSSSSSSSSGGGLGKALFLHPLDLSSFDSVREFAAHIKKQGQKDDLLEIHVLINNAGRNTTGKSTEKVSDQDDAYLDLMFQTNFLGHYLLTSELLDCLLSAKGGARVVNVSSVMHHFCGAPLRNNLDSIEAWKDCATFGGKMTALYSSTYGPSKLAAILFTLELNRRQRLGVPFGGNSGSSGSDSGRGMIQAIAVNPGAVNSDIWRDYPKCLQWAQNAIYLTNQQGCQTSVTAAVLPQDLWTNKQHDLPPVPYLQPYPVVWNVHQPAFPPFEMLAPFAGPMLTKPRLPMTISTTTTNGDGNNDGAIRAAAALWQASQELTGAQWGTSVQSKTKNLNWF